MNKLQHLKMMLANNYEQVANSQNNLCEEDYDCAEDYQADVISTASRLGTLNWVMNLINDLSEKDEFELILEEACKR